MTRVRLATVFVPFSLVCLTCMLWTGTARAQFPGQGTDQTTSLGQFTIDVNSMFVNQVVSLYNGGQLPGYMINQPLTGPEAGHTFLTSPLLYDGTTTIARSANTTEGGATMLPMGSPYYATSTGTFAATPAGWNPAPGTNEVYTAVQSLNLTNLNGGGPVTSVTAGQAAPGGTPISYGEVASQSNLPTGSFPANSFFDVFVNVQVGSTLGSLDLYNTAPLLVESTNLMAFPPTVLYTHDQSSGPAPELFINAPNSSDPFHAYNGDPFGTIIVSGHGAGYNNGQSSTGQAPDPRYGPAAFEKQYDQLLAQAGVIPEPSTWIMLVTAGLMVPAYVRWSSRRRA